MMRLLLFIKHHMRFLWSIAEWGNGIVFKIFFRRIVCKNIQSACKKFSNGDVVCRPLADHKSLALPYKCRNHFGYFHIFSIPKLFKY